MGDKVKDAFEVIKQAMIDDDNPSQPSNYADAWHCKLAMMCADAILDDLYIFAPNYACRIGNEVATRFMKQCFGVDTKAQMSLKSLVLNARLGDKGVPFAALTVINEL